MKMTAAPTGQRKALTGQLFKDQMIQSNNGKLLTKSVEEIFKLNAYHQKMSNRSHLSGTR
jgi:hypothetical protein